MGAPNRGTAPSPYHHGSTQARGLLRDAPAPFCCFCCSLQRKISDYLNSCAGGPGACGPREVPMRQENCGNFRVAHCAMVLLAVTVTAGMLPIAAAGTAE